jgi:PTH2 family peptidyl-tRNA hydrolase
MTTPEREVKQVIVIRRDLKVRRGKEISQGAHAALAHIARRLRPAPAGDLGPEGQVMEIVLRPAELKWLFNFQTKIALQVPDLETLLALAEAAEAAGIEIHLITDAGLTEFGGVPTVTALAIGPDYSDRIDPITSSLKLY